MHSRILATSFTVLALAGSGCDEYKRLMEKVDAFSNEEQAFTPVPGQPIGSALEPYLAATSADTDATLAALAVAESEAATALTALTGDGDGKPATVSPEAAAVLTGTQKDKQAFDSDLFKRDDNSYYSKTPPARFLRRRAAFNMVADTTVNWSAAKSEFVVSVLDRMPVRSQGERGTCASHSAVGQIEGLVLKKHTDVSAVDLSEQRFYWLSKPEHWSDGGNVNDGGSDPGSGMAASARRSYDGSPAYDATEIPEDYNIPLEPDCPYDQKLGANDLQVPMAATCRQGAVRVTDFAAWMYNWGKWLETPQQIYDWLVNSDYPVVVYTKLSANWEDNDGMITLAGAGGAGGTAHAAGHAYLIVGARKLDASKYPDEGGMCFIVRNSWGKGWGVNGLSCMTLAWFNAWRYPDGFAQTLDVAVNTTRIASAIESQKLVPEDAAEPDPGTKGSDKDQSYGQLKNRKGTARVDRLVGDGPSAGLTTAADFAIGALIAGDGQPYKMLWRLDGTTLTVRGMLRGNKKMTNDLALTVAGGKVMRAVDGRGELQFGEWDSAGQTLVLCGKKHAATCDLNYVESWNELVTGLTEAAARAEDSTGPYDWKGLTVSGYGIEVSLPEGFGQRVDLRFQLDGVYTNPQRFAIDPVQGLVKYQSKAIGSITDSAVCSGSYKDLCRIVVAGEDFHVLFKAQKKQ